MAKVIKIQTNFTAGEVTPKLGARVDIAKYNNSVATLENFLVSRFGAAYRRPGTYYLGQIKNMNKVSRLIPFEYTADTSYILEFNDLSIRFITNHGFINAGGGGIYEISSPYTEADLPNLQFAQSYDVLYIVHPDYAPRKLIRYADNNWTLSVVDFDEPPYLDENGSSVTLTPSATTGSITVTASSNTFVSTDVGRAIRYKSGPDETNTTTYTGNGTQTYFDIPFYPNSASDLEVYLVAANGSRTLQTNPTQYTVSGGQVIMVTAPTSSQRLTIKEKNAGSGEWGWMTITAYTSATQVTATVERELAGTNASVYWRLGAWSDTTGYPRAVVFHEQRLVFAGSVSQPQTIWLSATQDFENFQPDNLLYKGAVDDTTSITVSIAEYKPQPILWLASQKILLFGTSNAVHSITGGANGITPTSIQSKVQVNLGAEPKAPILTNNNILFIERLSRSVRSIGYDFAIDGYRPEDLSLLSPHITRDSGFTEIQYQNTPSSVIWARLEDGSLVSCTHLPEQQVTGWARHPISGTDVEVESLAVIPSTTHDELYLIVKRTINGSTKRYIEYLTAEFDGWEKEDAFFVDCGLTYDGSPATTISGLSHLEGETVTILADGYAVPDTVVSGGQITLSLAASKVHVGYGYESILATNNIEGGSQFGSAQAQIARVLKTAVRMFESLGMKVGRDASSLTTVEFRQPGDPMDTSPPLFTGDKLITFKYGYDINYKVYLKQDQPLPVTVLGLIIEAEVADG